MKQLYKISNKLRFQILELNHKTKTAHLGSSLSCIDLLTVLYVKILNLNKKNNSDKFILSKGHAALALYVILAHKKIITKKNLQSYCKVGSLFEEHPSSKVRGIEASTGSLGHGLSIATGIALGNKIKNNTSLTYVLMSDGECNEGSVWEAAMFAKSKKLNNLCAIVDFNKWQATQKTLNNYSIEDLSNKFISFGWNSKIINGHSHKDIFKDLNNFKNKYKKNNNPTIFIADTIKGKGISFMQNDNNWHYRSPNIKELELSKKELKI